MSLYGGGMETPQVYKSNALVEASYRLSVYEQRIVLACIAQVRRDEPLTDQHLYTVSAKQIADMTGTKIGTAYQNLKVASERLFRREVTLYEAPNGTGGAKVRLTRWVQEVVYQEAHGTVALRFSQSILPYLSQLTEQFTRYALSDVARMESVHAIRLYELLCQWREAREREVSIDWLRETLQLDGKYSAIKDLKKRVIQPAVDEINEHSPMWVKWDQRKNGRRVTHLVFTFGEKPKSKPNNKSQQKTAPATHPQAKEQKKNRGFTDEDIAKSARPGETWEQARQRLEKEPHEEVRRKYIAEAMSAVSGS